MENNEDWLLTKAGKEATCGLRGRGGGGGGR